MHVTIHRVRNQDICPSPNTMPKNCIGKYAHQQASLRSLPEGKGSVLIELWERQVALFLASKQQPKWPLRWCEFALLALLHRPPVDLLHTLVTTWCKSFAQSDVGNGTDNASIALSWPMCTYIHVCPQEGWMHTSERKGVPSTVYAMMAPVCT